MDDLLARLRTRAADPERRTDVRQSEFVAEAATLDLGGLLRLGRAVARDLGNVVAANREGRVDEAAHARATELESSMTTPAPSVLPAPADEATLAAAESRLGFPLPPELRRAYAEVADGGFGPGVGLLPVSMIVREYEHLRDGEELPRGRTWPEGLLPVVEREPGWDCVEAPGGRVIAWDPEELSERASEDRFRRSFEEQFPSVEAWLEDWVGSKTQAERTADMMAALMSPESQIRQAREAREAIGRMTPEERARLGLPEVGWERVVWGGLGWNEDEATAD